MFGSISRSVLALIASVALFQNVAAEELKIGMLSEESDRRIKVDRYITIANSFIFSIYYFY